MVIPMDELMARMTDFLWPFFRIAALLMVVPIIGARSVPGIGRVGVAALITLVAYPMLPPAPTVDPFSAPGLAILAGQVLIGLAMGFMVRLVFAAVEMGGNIVGQTMGLGFAQMMDPSSGVTVPVVSQFYNLMATLIFLALDGHLIVIDILIDSFHVMPVVTEAGLSGGLWMLVSWGVWIFKGAMLIALPAVSAMLLVNIAFGVMMRAAPQLNIFAVGFPVTLMLGFVFILVSLTLFLPQFSGITDDAFQVMQRIAANQDE
ncbi:MAG: flagellar biosynthetic protein FliR [Gammaproteobacteria bacterium]|nr:flagellar biosynthetic protein FliR [Gammaproteobacteria bacterium]